MEIKGRIKAEAVVLAEHTMEWLVQKGRPTKRVGGLHTYNGFFICGFAATGPLGLDVIGTELTTIREGLLLMQAIRISHFAIASDSKEAVSMLKERNTWWSNIGNVVEDIRRLMVELAVSGVLFQPRFGYRVAHALARFGLTEGTTFVWEDVAPPWLESSLAKDMELG
ncbi:PREDICTED: LOC18774466 [Prunus dulcis]|uniref:PREDICTED: LOC18774466 n=1 Tax=Prunus dulcis TaxID=3755 RepID=A0A5E4GFS1_PRUDU|nr:PREDICTED: LOC18774466 [Prunus dulcis]